MSISSILIANRGEIAVRIIRASQELGIKTIQVYSDADKDSLPVVMADDAINIGPPQPLKSYLNQEKIIEVAKDAGADAIHPGYGFLSENGIFADKVAKAGLTFIGPKGKTISQLGDKVIARQLAEQSGLPTVPGSNGLVTTLEMAKSILEEFKFPVLIKASAGGGGRGIRIANNWEEFERLFPVASLEAKTFFGDGGLFIEKYLPQPRHIEVQVLGDGESTIHVFDRECSLQRRRQKIWEEAPASPLNDSLRNSICTKARDFAQMVGYSGAGTVEFLFDETTEEYYFLEMNTRIQVEHPVTEMITGIDLVREGISIAGGKKISIKQKEIEIRGHAIECRINAEDPRKNFLPQPGHVEKLRFPSGPGVRFDTMLYEGYNIPPFYDSLLGKLIVWDKNRSSAMERMKRALAELEITGIETTKTIHQALINDPQVRQGNVYTSFLDDWLENGNLI